MTSQEKLKRAIDTLRESIKLDWQDLASKQLTTDERHGLRQHIEWCNSELKNLYERLETEV
ncbi:MAG: hypothetical protein WC685_06890 [Methylobacter sp.]|jgi:hypothetical protein